MKRFEPTFEVIAICLCLFVATINTTEKNEVYKQNPNDNRQITENVLDYKVRLVEENEMEEQEHEYAEFIVTAYCGCEKCCGVYSDKNKDGAIGASGKLLKSGYSVAVDNSLYKFGTKFKDLNGNIYEAQDTGKDIKGNRLDLFFDSHDEAACFGVKNMFLEIVE